MTEVPRLRGLRLGCNAQPSGCLLHSLRFSQGGQWALSPWLCSNLPASWGARWYRQSGEDRLGRTGPTPSRDEQLRRCGDQRGAMTYERHGCLPVVAFQRHDRTSCPPGNVWRRSGPGAMNPWGGAERSHRAHQSGPAAAATTAQRSDQLVDEPLTHRHIPTAVASSSCLSGASGDYSRWRVC